MSPMDEEEKKHEPVSRCVGLRRVYVLSRRRESIE